ncbi:hypothetical protein HLI_17575 [Halobacillus litoralis]|uniref:Uncharacterized protein n=1 Tax=Halobacillus litoralis TaxID=45668 RepID=A0A410MGS8_9BACI|nr:hypothetical protein HLI_17575 [Halobacillus litoralis]
MAQLERKRNTYLNWKYAMMLFLIPIAFYLVSLRESITPLQHILYVGIIIWLALVGIMGVTNHFQRLKVYGYLYLISSLLFAYMGLVFIW